MHTVTTEELLDAARYYADAAKRGEERGEPTEFV